MPTTTTQKSAASPLGSYPVDPGAPLFVAKATIASATIGAVTGASVGVVRSQNPFVLSLGMTLNCSIASLAFFGLREYGVTPSLVVLRSRNQVESAESSPSSIGELRKERIVDSAIAGAISAGGLSLAFRGKHTAFRAGLTGALIASMLQFSVNQLRIVRLELLRRRDSTTSDMHSTPTTPHSTNPSNNLSINTPSETSSKLLSQSSPHPPSIGQSMEFPLRSADSEAQSRDPRSLPSRIMNSLSLFLPIRKLSDDQYLETLVKKKSEVEKRLQKIEEEQVKMFEVASAAEAGSKA